MSKNTYVDVYEQLIDEDPKSKDHFEAAQTADNQLELFDQLEEEAYEDLSLQTKKSRLIQSGGDIRTQSKRPLSQKVVRSF